MAIFLFMLATFPLHAIAVIGNIYLPLHTAARLGTLQNKTVRPIALYLVNRFFIAYRKGAGLIRANTLSIMVGYCRGAATVLAAFQPLILSRRPRFGTLDGGYPTFKTGNHMNTLSNRASHAQNSTNLDTDLQTALNALAEHAKSESSDIKAIYQKLASRPDDTLDPNKAALIVMAIGNGLSQGLSHAEIHQTIISDLETYRECVQVVNAAAIAGGAV